MCSPPWPHTHLHTPTGLPNLGMLTLPLHYCLTPSNQLTHAHQTHPYTASPMYTHPSSFTIQPGSPLYIGFTLAHMPPPCTPTSPLHTYLTPAHPLYLCTPGQPRQTSLISAHLSHPCTPNIPACPLHQYILPYPCRGTSSLYSIHTHAYQPYYYTIVTQGMPP